MGNPFLDALGWVGESLDKPGAAVRGLLAGRPDQLANLIPFSDTMGITDPSQRTSGRGLLESLGAMSPKEEGSGFDLGDLAGMGTEIATNPLTYLGPAGIMKGARSFAGRGGTVAREAESLAGLGQAGETTASTMLENPFPKPPASLPAATGTDLAGTPSGPLETMLEKMADAAERKPQSMANMLADRRKFPVVEISKGPLVPGVPSDEENLLAKIRGHLPGDPEQRFTRRQLNQFAHGSTESGFLGEYLKGPDRAAFVYGNNISKLDPWELSQPGTSLREVRRHEVTHGLNELARPDSLRGIAYKGRTANPIDDPAAGIKRGLGQMMDETLARASELPGAENQINTVLNFLSDQGTARLYRKMVGIGSNSPYTNFMTNDAPAIIKSMRDQLIAAPKETLPALLRALAEKAGQTGLAVSPLAIALGSDNG